jgi:hypothetical protein
VRKKCSSDGEKLLKFKSKGREFAKIYSNSQNNFCNRMPF